MLLRLKKYLLLCFILSLNGCDNDTELDKKPEGTPAEVTLRLVLSGRHSPVTGTRAQAGTENGIHISYGNGNGSNATRSSITDDPAYQVTDLNIIQFGANGTMLASAYIDDIATLTPEESGDRLVYTPGITLSLSPQSTVCIVANSGDPALFDGIYTLNEYRKMEIDISDPSSLLTNSLIPMAGSYTGIIEKDGEITVELERLLSKVSVTVNTGTLSDERKLELNTAELISVPKKASWFDRYRFRTIGTDGYPSVVSPGDPSQFMDHDAQDISSSTTAEWYITENIRGEGTNTGPEGQKYKYAVTDPTYSADTRSTDAGYEEYEAGFSTRLFLRGKYTTEAEGERNILITLYPGGDVVNDFNIVRNSHYDISVNITDIDPVQDGGTDHRIYLSDIPPVQQGNSIAHTPYIFDIYTNSTMATVFSSFWLDPLDDLEYATLYLLLPDGTRLEDRFTTGDCSMNGNDYTKEHVFFVRLTRQDEGQWVYSWLVLTLTDGREVPGESAMIAVRGLN